ncbi:hypothetical protein SSS_06920 [Sarcoptes scabiei]|nr:hypothetical protein SSS_06920 [Sarcoptes scabiei]
MSTSKTPTTRLQGRRMASSSRSSASEEIPRKLLMMMSGAGLSLLVIFTLAYHRFHKSIILLPRMTSASGLFQSFALIPILVSIWHVIYNRLTNKVYNPLSGREHFVEKSNRILTNTIEHSLINLFAELILAVYLPNDMMHWIPLMVFLFVFGRIAFWIGYTIHPKFRGLGFAMNFVPLNIAFFVIMGYATGTVRRFYPSSALKTEL